MKKTFKIALLALGILAMQSCHRDDFDIRPVHLDAPSTTLTTPEGMRYAMDGAYDSMKNLYASDNGNLVILADALADNLVANPSGRQTNLSAYEWGYGSGTSDAVNLFYNAYNTISRANLVLDNILNLPEDKFRTNLEAEARAVRGYMHFEVARAYAKIPTQSADANASLGIPYVTKFDPFIRIARDASVAESYQKIVEDLEFAYNNIDTNKNIVRLNKVSVAAILNEVYLYMGEYKKAVEYGEFVIANSPSVGSLTEFPKIWQDDSNDGILFKLGNANASYDNTNVGVAYNQGPLNAIRSEHSVNYDLYKKYTKDDVRSSWFITAPYAKVNYNHIIKYHTRKSNPTIGVVDPKVLRTAEVYLSTAEALLRQGGNTTRALELLNAVRAQRYKTNATLNIQGSTQILEAILEERRLELAFENDRFWTLKRLGKDVERSKYGVLADGTGNPPTNRVLKASDYRWQLPIPLTELNKNPNMKQNPGY